ncbi:hypothetical protein PAMP_003719 [Pampus punctatissimus]
MFRSEQAALLAIQVLIMCHVFAVSHPNDHRDVLVSRSNNISFTCNVSVENALQIVWKKEDRLLFSYNILKNKTVNNIASQSVSTDPNFHLKLNIFNAQHEHAGLYKCEVTGKTNGTWTIAWNLTVLEINKEISSWYHYQYVLTPAIGLLLCGFSAAVCLCRKLWTVTPNQDQVSDEFQFQLGEEVVLTQLGSAVDHRTNRQRSDYKERLNSIYDLN